MRNFDTIIVWSWLGWLSAGALLAKTGKKVLVLESHFQIGGYATNFRRKDFVFDVSLHQIGGIRVTGFKNILQKAGVYEKLEFIRHKYLYEAIYPDFELQVENGNAKKFQNDLKRIFPNESWGISKWFFLMRYVGWQVRIWDAGQRWRFFLPAIMLFAPILIPVLAFWSRLTIARVLDFCTKDVKLRKVLMEFLGYFGDDLNISAIYYLVPCYGYYFDGGYSVRWGGQAVSDAFAEVIRENGGTILANHAVEEIILRDGQAVGVKTKKGEFFAENVICNASPFVLYGKLLKNWEGSRTELERLERYEIWPTLGSVYLGLDTTIDGLNPRYRESSIVSISETYDVEFAKNRAIGFSVTDHRDNNGIPEGKSVLTVAVFDTYWDWENLSKDDYAAKKAEETKKLLDRLEKIFPNLRKHVEVCEFGTPKTMERYTDNARGAVYGFSQKNSTSGVGHYGNTTPIRNLLLSSAWSFWWGYEGVIRAGREAVRMMR